MKKVTRNDFHPVKGPRTHINCLEQTGVMRPGKTAYERWRAAQKAAGKKV